MNKSKAKNRLERRFEQLRAQSRAALVTFVTAGDPDQETSYRIFSGLAAAGADIIELGMPFSDPMADGPTIQTSSQRALAAGMTLQKTLEQVGRYRRKDDDTPIILMGYYNPIHHFGVEAFLDAATEAGVDGLIIVDLPVEEDDELCHPAMTRGIHWIRLTTPTTDEQRLPRVLTHTSGFVYYVSVLGVTGTRSAGDQEIERALARLRAHTDLPVAVGFGIRTAEQVAKIGAIADAVVVGSAVVAQIADNLDEDGRATDGLVDQVTGFVSELASGLRRD